MPLLGVFDLDGSLYSQREKSRNPKIAQKLSTLLYSLLQTKKRPFLVYIAQPFSTKTRKTRKNALFWDLVKICQL